MFLHRRAARLLLCSLLVSITAIYTAVGCSGTEPVVTPDDAGSACTADLASIQSAIFTTSCALSGCHTGAAPSGDLDLSADAEAVLVGVPSATCPGTVRVVPGSPSTSLLYQKLMGTQTCGSPMPLGTPLSAELEACVEAWITGLPAVDAGQDSTDECERCGGQGCVDIQTDPAHCGGCDVVCPGSACVGGACGCAPGLSSCGGACVDTQLDPTNCGACGKACPAGQACAAGACVCGGGTTSCNGACVDTQTDPANCAACGKACATGAACADGACACSGADKVCNGACVDTTSSPTNCGACGKVCAAGSVCLLGSCAAGCGALTKCGAACVDTQTSTGNCGACGVACAVGQACTAGVCGCPNGEKLCGGACVDTATSGTNCGMCGVICPAAQSCVGGQCACGSGEKLCSGACVDTATSGTNCGACGVVCAAGQTCQGGACACPSGQALCNGACTDTQSNTASCGACGNTCAPGQACVAGVCTCGVASVSYAAAVQPIFTASCANVGCHTGPGAAQGLNLTAAVSYAKLVNVTATECNDGRKRVLPGQPSTSYLMDKLLGVDMCFGGQMPKAGVSISAAQLQTISDWICEGAPNN